MCRAISLAVLDFVMKTIIDGAFVHTKYDVMNDTKLVDTFVPLDPYYDVPIGADCKLHTDYDDQ